MLHLLVLLASATSLAPVSGYQIANRAEEIALARSAAPASISNDATILVLGAKSYEVAVQGKNGFVCLVERSWFSQFSDPGFWDPKGRSPNCLNKPASTSVLPEFLDRTKWVLAGDSLKQIVEKEKAGHLAHRYNAPAIGSIAYMLSKHGYLDDKTGGPLWPHMMFFVPAGQAALWGANLTGSPLLTTEFSPYEPNIVFMPAKLWSDGSTPTASDRHPHVHTHRHND